MGEVKQEVFVSHLNDLTCSPKGTEGLLFYCKFETSRREFWDGPARGRMIGLSSSKV